MKCAFCKEEISGVSVLVPVWLPDGSLQAFACLKCSKEHGVYCEEHKRPHMGFEDKTTACLLCIEDRVNAERHRAQELMDKVSVALTNRERIIMSEMLQSVSVLSRNSKEETLLRYLAIKAERLGKNIDQILEVVQKERTVASLVGHRFLQGMLMI